jgi:hypothetical protein
MLAATVLAVALGQFAGFEWAARKSFRVAIATVVAIVLTLFVLNTR